MRTSASGGLNVDRERSVRVVFQRLILVLGAERVALDLVWCKEMLRIVERQRPEAIDRRCPVVAFDIAPFVFQGGSSGTSG